MAREKAAVRNGPIGSSGYGLVEAPEWVPPSNFNLDDDAVNRAFATRQMARVAEIIKATPDYRLVRTGDGDRGWFILYNETTKRADYVIQYQTRRWNWLPRTVTQCILWRNTASIYTRGITVDVFFNILLPRYDAVMSDRQQTDQGHGFWLGVLADAVARGKQVGIADTNAHRVDWFSGHHTAVSAWVRQHDTFGRGNRYQALRYILLN